MDVNRTPRGGNEKSNQVPANKKLWELIVSQAKTRFRVYPSPAASHWVHQRYLESGGTFIGAQQAKKNKSQKKKK